MKELRRTQVGEFELKDCIKLDEIEKSINENSANSGILEINNKIITIEQYFKNKNSINLDENTLKMYLNGVKLKWNLDDGIYKVYNNGKFIGIGVISNNLLKRDIVI